MLRPSFLVALLALAPVVSAQTASFPNRVAAGDVTQTSAVLWARAEAPGLVWFELGTNPKLHGHRETRARWVADANRPAKVAFDRLQPGKRYYYRVTDAAGETDGGTFRTPHRPNARHGLQFGVSGDARGDLAPFTSVANAPGKFLDFFVNLGDTIYADVESPILPGLSQATTLAEYRLKHQEVNSAVNGVNGLGDLRTSTAFFATIDDHEVTNDFSGGAHPSSDPRFDLNGAFINETDLYGNGLQAFVEYNPLRPTFYGVTMDPRTEFKRKLYRARVFGKDAAIFMLDARSFRDQGLPEVSDPTDPVQVGGFLAASFDPSRTMLGQQQIMDLLDDLARAQAAGVVWKFVMVPEPIQNLGVLAASDRFEGYAAERTAILQFIHSRGIDNVVFVAADIHGTLVNNLSYQVGPGMPQIATNAFEITTGAIAFDAPFGPTVVGLGAQLGVVTPAQLAQYQALPLPLRDQFVKTLVDQQIIPLGYDPLGLDGSTINATLLAGDYVATHYYGWTQFQIDELSSDLTVTTWGIDPAQAGASPAVVSQFVVTPQ